MTAPALDRGRLTLTVALTMVFFTAFGMTLVALPRFVIDELGSGETAAGLAFGAYALSAILVRPLVGRAGAVRGRRWLIVTGATVSALALFGHVLASTLALLLVARLLVGVGQAGVLVGVTTMALDLSPPERRGEASSYVMVAIQLGVGTGPLIGEPVIDGAGFDELWVVAAAISALAAVGARFLPGQPPDVGAGVAGFGVHPAGLRPGLLLGAGMFGFAGYLAFIPLYGPEVGIDRVAVLFLLSSGVVAFLRLVAAKLPDRLGPRPGSRLALGLMTVGLGLLGGVATTAALYLGTIVMAAGMAFLAPSLAVAATEGTTPEERIRVMATFTIFIDLGSAVGPAVLGVVADIAGLQPAFLLAAVSAAVGFLGVGPWIPRRPAGSTG